MDKDIVQKKRKLPYKRTEEGAIMKRPLISRRGITKGEFHKILDKASQPIDERKDKTKSDSEKSGA